MATQWQLTGDYFENCNCNVVCPCLASPAAPLTSRPSEGACDVALVFHVDQGKYGGLALDGLNIAVVAHAPGPMAEGNWSVAAYIDERADEQQTAALGAPAASGKGTLARRVAERFNLAHLDTGRLYRATAHLVLAAGGNPADPQSATSAARRVDPASLADPALLTEEVAQASSVVAAIPEVRAALLERQRDFAAHPPAPPKGHRPRGAVLDGRDIGTAVCPGATVKLFVTASAEARAERRLRELRQRA